MKYLYRISFLLIGSLAFIGCPYSSSVPIDQPSVAIDERLLGRWEKPSSDEVYKVEKEDAYTYRITEKKTDSDPSEYLAYLSDIDGTRFLNLYEESEYETTYYFYKVEISQSGSKLTLSPLTENIDEKFTSSEELKSFIRRNMNFSFFYETEEDEYFKGD